MLGMLLTIVMAIVGIASFNSYAAGNDSAKRRSGRENEITHISLTLRKSAEEESGFECYAKGSSYYADEVTLISGFDLIAPGPSTQGFSIEEIEAMGESSHKKELEIILHTDDEHYFGVMKEKNIKLKGVNAACTSAVRKEGKQELVLTVEIDDSEKKKSKIREAEWINTQTGLGEWEHEDKDCIYWLRLYKDGEITGGRKITNGRRFDFTSMMKEPGYYKFMVQAVDETDSPYSMKKSPELYFDGAGFAEGNNARNSDICQQEETIVSDEENVPIQNNWFNDGEWHFCGENGIMKRDTWFLWRGKPYMVDENGVWTEKKKSTIINQMA